MVLKPGEFWLKVAFGEEVSPEKLGFPEMRSRSGPVFILEGFCVAGATFRHMDTAVFVACATLSSSTKFGQVRSVQEVSHQTQVNSHTCKRYIRNIRKSCLKARAVLTMRIEKGAS